MGFLFNKRTREDYHGTGSPNGPQAVNPAAAISSVVAISPTAGTANQNVNPLAAVSSSIVNSGQPGIGVNPAPAISSSTASTPNVTGQAVNNSTGQYIMGTNGAIPLWFDRAARYTTDPQWRAQIHNSISVLSNASLKGTGGGSNAWPSGTRYGDGQFVDLYSWVNTPDPAFGPNFNEPCFEGLVKAQNIGSSTPMANMTAVLTSAAEVQELIYLRREAYCSTPPFTAVGDATSTAGINFNNSGQAKSYKMGSFGGFLGSGRMGMESGNGSNSGQAVNPSVDYFYIGTKTGNSIPESATGVRSGAEFNDGNLYVVGGYLEQWTRISDGTFWLGCTFFRRPDSSSTWAQISPRVVANSSSITKFYELVSTHLNYNQSRSTDLKKWETDRAFFNPDQDAPSADPAGFLAAANATTPVNPTSVANAVGTATTVTADIAIGKYTSAIRLKLDGAFVGTDYILPREVGELQITNSGTPVAGVANTSFTGLTLSVGSHTVQFFAVAGDGTHISASGPSTTVTV